MGRAFDITRASSDARLLLAELYHSAVRAAAPGRAVETALDEERPSTAAPWIIALGKAAHPMAAAAVRVLERKGMEPAGGVVVAPNQAAFKLASATCDKAPHGKIAIALGDHPEPGPGSLHAAGMIATVSRQACGSAEVWVLLSGGATSLAAAPIEGISAGDLAALYRLLLHSGLDISSMNTVRKRFSRWGAGRLAVALAPARVLVLVVSDVVGDDLAAIGSGPCVPDESSAADVRRLLTDAGLWEQTPETMRAHLARTERDPSFETPKSEDPCFSNVGTRIIANNATALRGAAERALTLGIQPVVREVPLSGDATLAGKEIVRILGDNRRSTESATSIVTAVSCHIMGGETVLNLSGADADSLGGRCQELALTAAREMKISLTTGLTLLAAGTDGRDGPTDAAGAIVDGGTWERIRLSGRNPDDDLGRHDSYHALDSAGALLRTGHTGTNVMDVVMLVKCET